MYGGLEPIITGGAGIVIGIGGGIPLQWRQHKILSRCFGSAYPIPIP